MREFRSEVWLPAPLERVFEFFSNAANLQELTPEWVHFEIQTPRPIAMRAGTVIDYRLRIRGLPVKWKTLIKAWEPPFRFIDEQVRGPYRHWTHEHLFEAKDGGTLMKDHVSYEAPFGFLTHPLFVSRDVDRIFAFRREILLKRDWKHRG